ncbi:2-dehydropantoate 2-reductase [Methanocella sp. CWC-04]|uniref:2-dehydropantoate 2-reductase n=1 Tax=Methanooceanicella nereidis TaxID=2052831 RepID=A0AAP2W662_9EURY|nr:2-dehydropantoate 2-reductase [Methanocella sp. CWC-04]MCD1293756.1 2-dehydropantoate 2-reductase [Methanocella sp. CWC-04]
MKITVIGAGALGTFYGGMMSAAGYDVTIVCREKDVETLKKGINIKGQIEKQANPDVSSSPPLSDIVFTAVKSYDVESAISDLPLKPDTVVIIIHNGLGCDEIAASKLGKGHVGIGVSYSGVTFVRPGTVSVAGYTETVFGSIENDVSARLGEVVKILESSGLKARVAEDIRSAQWEKLYANVGINAITAITGLKNGMLLEVPSLRSLVVSAVEEAGRVSAASGIKTDVDPVDKTFKVIKDTYNNRSSMLQDISKEKPTEIDVLNGKVSEIGHKLGIPTPVNDTITALVKGIEKRHGN